MGPQVSYFTPEILMEQDIHGPGIDADGAAFPGTNLYVQLGHGRDYAWSATSAGQNIIDTFAVPLCNPGGGRVDDSNYYLLHGRCVPMETLTRHESWTPNAADSTPGGLGHLPDPADGVRDRDRPREDPRPAGRLHEPALDLHARARLGRRLHAAQQPGGRSRTRRTSFTPPTRSSTRSTGSTPTTSTSRTSTRA